jgi:hypothetical protein
MSTDTSGANARALPKTTDRRVIKKKARSAPRAGRSGDHPIARLSFVKTLDHVREEPSGRAAGRCFWNVTPSGNYTADCIIGEKLALEYLAYEEETKRDAGTILAWIVGDMPQKQTGVEVSFLIMVAYAASAGAQRARDVAAYWERCRKEEAA